MIFILSRHCPRLPARYYFRLRHWCIMLGVETPGLYEASPPRRRSDSKATEATAIAEAAAAAAVSAKARTGEDARRRQEAALTAAGLSAEDFLDVEGEDTGGGRKERDNLLQIAAAARLVFFFLVFCEVALGVWV